MHAREVECQLSLAQTRYEVTVDPRPVQVNPVWGNRGWVNLGRASPERVHAREPEWVISLAEIPQVQPTPARVHPEWGNREWVNQERASPERARRHLALELPRVQWADNLIV